MQVAVVFNSHIRIEVIQDKNEKDSRYHNKFKVVNTISGQFTEISAMTVEQMNEWVKAINTVSYYMILYNVVNIHTYNNINVTRSEKSRLPHTQQQDTLFTIKQ